MTRRELREHSFKVLFRADFYPVEEMDEQIERYFGAPVEADDNERPVAAAGRVEAAPF